MPNVKEMFHGIVKIESETMTEFDAAFKVAGDRRQAALRKFRVCGSTESRELVLSAINEEQEILNGGLVTRMRVLGLRLPFPFAWRSYPYVNTPLVPY